MKETSLNIRMSDLPNWSDLNAQSMLSELPIKLKELRQSIENICHNALKDQNFSWRSCHTIQELLQNVNDWWSPLEELSTVKSTPALREVMQKAQEPWIKFSCWFAHYRPLFDAVSALLASTAPLSPVQRKVLEHHLHDCKQQGIHLTEADRMQLQELELELSDSELRFENNLLDANEKGALWLLPEVSVKGLPEMLKKYGANEAIKAGKSGIKLPLDDATVPLVLAYAENRELRSKMHYAYFTRASFNASGSLKDFDNSTNISKILELRQKISRLLRYENFAAYQMEKRLLNTPDKVKRVLKDLLSSVHGKIELENADLARFALEKDGLEKLEPWDRAYYSRLLKQSRFQVDFELMREYYPLSSVLEGLFGLIESLFGVTFVARPSVNTWDPTVLFYELREKEGGVLWGGVYLDLFARNQKQSGAWVSGLYGLKRLDEGEIRRPVGVLHTNFMPPSEHRGPLLTHLEIVTLFHEMGHMLQMLLTKVEEIQFSGLNGLPLDALEIASQWMEEWAWDPIVLKSLSSHKETAQAIPDALIASFLKSRAHQAAYDLTRQISFSLFDLSIHEKNDPTNGRDVLTLWKGLRETLFPEAEASYAVFPNTFSHIFSSSYAAGYYSYLWSEVLAVDLFVWVKEADERPSERLSRLQKLKNTLFAQGGSEDAIEQFKKLRNRSPEIHGILRRRGLLTSF